MTLNMPAVEENKHFNKSRINHLNRRRVSYAKVTPLSPDKSKNETS